MRQSEWIIKVLQESSGIEVPEECKNYIRLYAKLKNLMVCVEDCVTTSIRTCTSKMIWVQEGKEIKDTAKLDKNKPALELFPQIGDVPGFYVFLYKPQKNNKPKTKIIYGIRTTNDEYGRSSVKVYCLNYEIALRESKKHYDWYCGTPVGEKGIEAIELIIE